MSPRGRRPPTTPGEVPLHRLQRQRGAGRKPSGLAIPFIIVGGHGSPVTRRTSSPPPDWPSDMEELPTTIAQATPRTQYRIPTSYPGDVSRPRSSSAPPSAGSRSRNMYYAEDADITLVTGDQAEDVSSLTLVGESSFSEYDSDNSDNSNDEEYSDDDDEDEENEHYEEDDDEDMVVYYVESPIQEEDARRERTFEVEIPEHGYLQEQQEEEEEGHIEYADDNEIKEEEMDNQGEFRFSVKHGAPDYGQTPFPGTPPPHGAQLSRRNLITVEDGERFLDSQVYEASPTPHGNSQWLDRPLELTPGTDFFEGKEQWSSDWEGRALGSPLSRMRNRRSGIGGSEMEHQSAAYAECDDHELEPYTPEPEIAGPNTVVGYDDGELVTYTPEAEVDQNIEYDDRGLEGYAHGLRFYRLDMGIAYEGGELKPYTPELQANRQNTTTVHDEESLENHTSVADTIVQQSGVLPSLGHTAINPREHEGTEINNGNYNPPHVAPSHMNEPCMGSVGVDQNGLHQLPPGVDSRDGIGYGGGDNNHHMHDDDNDRMYAFEPMTGSRRRRTLKGRNVRETGSPNGFNMPLPPPSEFDSSDERPLSPIISRPSRCDTNYRSQFSAMTSDRANAIMAFPPFSNVSSDDECQFSPMQIDCTITAHSRPQPASNFGRSLQQPLLPTQRPTPENKAGHAITQNLSDDPDLPSPLPAMRWNKLLYKSQSILPTMVDDYQEGMDQQSSCDGDNEQSEDGFGSPISSVSYPPTNNPLDSTINGTQGGNLNDLNSFLRAKQGQREGDNSAVEARVDTTTRRLFALVNTPPDIPQNAGRPQARPSWLKSIAHPEEPLEVKPPTPAHSDLGTSIPSFRIVKKKDKTISLMRPIITNQHRVRKVPSREAKLAPRSRADGLHKSIFGFGPIVKRYFEDRKKEVELAASGASGKLEAPWLKRVETPRPKPWYLKTCIDDIPEYIPGHVRVHVQKTANSEHTSTTPEKQNRKRRASWDSRDDNPKKQRGDVCHLDDCLQNSHDTLNKLMKRRKYKSPGIFKSTDRFLDGTPVHPVDTSHRLDCFLAVATGEVIWFPAKEQESAWEHCGQEAVFGEYGLVSEMGLGDEARGLWAGKPENKGN